MSKHQAAEMIGTVSGLRGKSGEYCSSNFVLESCEKTLLGLLNFFLPKYPVHTKMKTADV